MGNCCTVEGAVDHWIFVKTGDVKGGQSEVTLKVKLLDEQFQDRPENTKTIVCYFSSDLSKPTVKECFLPEQFGRVKAIRLERDDSDPTRNWFCESVIINDRREGVLFYFPVMRWIHSGIEYEFYENDTFIAQNDPSLSIRDGYLKGLRAKELQDRQDLYQFGQLATGTPLQARLIPPDEIFDNEAKWSVDVKRAKLLHTGALLRVQRGNWQSIDELTQTYRDSSLPEPSCMDRWTDDLYFAAQRLVGCNPCMISLCTALPENMAVTAEMLKPFLEGWTLKQIIDAKRLFILDYEILSELPTKDENEVCAPMALFFITGEKILAPIAIQLYQAVRQDNPVYLPNDDQFAWLQAKMWLNHADACVHMAVHNIAYTHMITESISVSMNRNLTPTHPVYKLLQPHLHSLMVINQRSTNDLLKPNGWADTVMSIGREGVLELIRRGFENWSLEVQGNFMRELSERGVVDHRVLPNYSYREDGSLIYKAIETFVHRVLRYYYPTSDVIQKDFLIQQWAAELAAPVSQGGAGLKGVPNDGVFKSLNELQHLCVHVIFTCTAQFSALNRDAYNQYAFPPNYPLYLQNEPPEVKGPLSEDVILSYLPPKDVTMETMVVTKLLSTWDGMKSLGEHEFQYLYDPTVKQYEDQFRHELKDIEQAIRQRNEQRGFYYKYEALIPSNIPDFIST